MQFQPAAAEEVAEFFGEAESHPLGAGGIIEPLHQLGVGAFFAEGHNRQDQADDEVQPFAP